MANVLLGVTGSVAAVRTPRARRRRSGSRGHAVRVVATDAALYFFDPVTLDPSRVLRNPEVVVLDEDEWPGRSDGCGTAAATRSCTSSCGGGPTCSWSRRSTPTRSPSSPSDCATTA